MHSLFLNTLLFIGLFNTCIGVYAIPVSLVSSSNDGGIKYPLHVACECMFTLYVDGKYIGEGNKENYVPYGLITEWNDTKKYYPVIYANEPNIVAFHGVGGQYPAFPNGFIMDMNHGKEYTKHEEWKCRDFSKTANKVAPVDWFTFDYDDSEWEMPASYGANYQNNSFQIFENPRDAISLNAEWLWTKDNTVANVYCRKKNGNVGTIHVSKTIHSTPVQTSAPPPVSKTIHATPVQTSAPSPVSKTIHTTPVLKTIHTTPVQTSAPHIVQTSAPPPVQTSAPHIVQTSAPPPVQTSAPPPVSKTIHSTPVQTSAPPPVSKTIHSTPVQTSAPPPVQTSAPLVPSIVISPHIQIVIQNIKYSQRRSNAHLDNLFQRIKLYKEEYRLYKQLTIARVHLRRHYNALYYDIKHFLEKHNTYEEPEVYHSIPSDDKKQVTNIPHFIRSMHNLNASIKKIEQSIQFIKGNHKYILLRILNKLKIQYQEDTQRLFEIIEHT
jgi:hypothetical protein